MNTQQFLALDAAGKAALLAGAEHIGERYEPSYTVLLYHIRGLYIEAFYHRRQGIVQYNCITNIDALRPYLPFQEPDAHRLAAANGAQAKSWRSRFSAMVQQTIHYFTRRIAS